jgi:hypothetical protein
MSSTHLGVNYVKKLKKEYRKQKNQIFHSKYLAFHLNQCRSFGIKKGIRKTHYYGGFRGWQMNICKSYVFF